MKVQENRLCHTNCNDSSFILIMIIIFWRSMTTPIFYRTTFIRPFFLRKVGHNLSFSWWHTVEIKNLVSDSRKMFDLSRSFIISTTISLSRNKSTWWDLDRIVRHSYLVLEALDNSNINSPFLNPSVLTRSLILGIGIENSPNCLTHAVSSVQWQYWDGQVYS
jgi:hypothetical protein